MITFARRTLAVWLGVLMLGVAGKSVGAESPKCLPWPLDLSSSRAHVANNQEEDTGFAVLWYCEVPYGFEVAGFAGRKSQLEGGWLDLGLLALTSRSSFTTLWDKYMREGEETDPSLIRLFQSLYRDTKPDEPAYKVARNGTQVTRPTYLVVNGIRRTSSNGRVSIGAACQCKVLAIDGAKPYCSVSGLPDADKLTPLPGNTVALCETR